MEIRLKPIGEQVLVINGASSETGRVTAKRAADLGAKIVLAAHDERALSEVAQEIRDGGGRVIYRVADAVDPQQIEGIAHSALREFGRIDSWVNIAGAGVDGRSMDASIDDLRREFDDSYWGQVYGMRAAIPQLRRDGGAIINVAVATTGRAAPVHSSRSTARHALAAFTDALRTELEEEGAPISLTLIEPASIHTPFVGRAKSYLGMGPHPLQPVYAPEVVAEAIIEVAQRPVHARSRIHSRAVARPGRALFTLAGLGLATVATAAGAWALRRREARGHLQQHANP